MVNRASSFLIIQPFAHILVMIYSFYRGGSNHGSLFCRKTIIDRIVIQEYTPCIRDSNIVHVKVTGLKFVPEKANSVHV